MATLCSIGRARLRSAGLAGLSTQQLDAIRQNVKLREIDRLDINLNGVWRTFRAALPHVEKTKGYLLATSSMAAFVHSPLQTPYTASKAGVWAMCDSLRLEVGHLGVAVGSLHPTFFATPLIDDVIADPAGQVLWNNQTGLWKMMPLHDVVQGQSMRSSGAPTSAFYRAPTP